MGFKIKGVHSSFKRVNIILYIKSHSMQINCLSLCPEGKLILSGSHDGTIKVNKIIYKLVMGYKFSKMFINLCFS